MKIFIIKGREEECLALAKILHMKFCYLSFENVSHISCFNYVRPDFSRMRYVGGLCRPRSFLYQNFLLWLTLEGETTFDLIPAPTGYVGATTARSYTNKISISLHNGNWDRIFERISKIHSKMDFFNKSRLKYQNATSRFLG